MAENEEYCEHVLDDELVCIRCGVDSKLYGNGAEPSTTPAGANGPYRVNCYVKGHEGGSRCKDCLGESQPPQPAPLCGECGLPTNDIRHIIETGQWKPMEQPAPAVERQHIPGCEENSYPQIPCMSNPCGCWCHQPAPAVGADPKKEHSWMLAALMESLIEQNAPDSVSGYAIFAKMLPKIEEHAAHVTAARDNYIAIQQNKINRLSAKDAEIAELKYIVDWVWKKCEAYPKIAFPLGKDEQLPFRQQMQVAMHQTFAKACSADTWYRIASKQQTAKEQAESALQEAQKTIDAIWHELTQCDDIAQDRNEMPRMICEVQKDRERLQSELATLREKVREQAIYEGQCSGCTKEHRVKTCRLCRRDLSASEAHAPGCVVQEIEK